MKRVGGSSTPEQPEEIKREIEGLRTEIENAGNSLVDDLEAFLARTKDSEDPSVRTEAQSVLQRLQDFSILSQVPENSSGSMATHSHVAAPSDKTGSVWGAFVTLCRTIRENARQNGGSSKRSNSEPTG